MEHLEDIKIHDNSDGVKYGGYEDEYKLCVFEGNVDGVNERYEMRCRPDLHCCENSCCTLEEVTVPFWLMILFIALALLLLLLALGTLAWWCSKRKAKPMPKSLPKVKKVDKHDVRNDYRGTELTYDHAKGYEPLSTEEHVERTQINKNLKQSPHNNRYDRTVEEIRQRSVDDSKFGGDNAHGYLNPLYTPKSALRDAHRDRLHSDKISDVESQNTVIDRGGASNYNNEVFVPVEHASQVRRTDEADRRYGNRTPDSYRYGYGSPWRRGDISDDRGIIKETYEEKFEEKYSTEEYPDNYSEKFIPSPMEEQLLKPPEVKRIVEHSEDEISIPVQPETIKPPPIQSQRAQIAYYRPFIPDPMEETNIPQPERQLVSYHDISEVIEPPQQAAYSTLEKPKQKKAEMMYCRPGFDNVPSY